MPGGKYAVRCGGGHNHRFGLDDAILIKDNHIALAGGLRTAVERTRRAVGHLVKIEVEVDSLEQLREALDLGVDVVLLDNMPIETLREAVALARGRAITEASGGINPRTAAAIAATGVNLLSVGWLTHSASAGCGAGCGVSTASLTAFSPVLRSMTRRPPISGVTFNERGRPWGSSISM